MVEEKKKSKEKPTNDVVRKISETDFKKKVLALAKEGLTAEKIGQKLRDEGIHSNDYKIKLKEVLGNNFVNPDLKNVEAKLERIKKHYETNKQDKRAKREKDRIFSQVRKLKKYFGVPVK